MAPYRGDHFPSSLAQDVFVAEPAANAIAQLRLEQSGLTFSSEHILYAHKKWGQVEFLSSTDERFRPVDVVVGPDGALYVVDMYRGIIQDHYFLSDELRAQAIERQLDKPVGMGRLWRVRADNDQPLRPAPRLGDASTSQLVELLGHANAWHRETAQRLLLANREEGLNQHLIRAVETGRALQSVHALWTLAGRNALVRRTVLAALARKEVSVKLSALRAGHKTLRRKDLLGMAKHTQNPAIQQQRIMSLVEHNTHSDVQKHLIQILLANADDKYLPAAIRAAGFGQETALLRAMQKDKLWSGKLEADTKFVQQLVLQGFRAQPSKSPELLDFVHERAESEHWLQVAVLTGFYDQSRANGFERVVLAEPHPVFSSSDKALWPAMSRARRAFTWAGDDLAADAKPLSPLQQQRRNAGAEFYSSRCASCHGDDGKGLASLAPPLAESPWVTGPSERLARIMLDGLSGEIEVAGTLWNGVMPGHRGQSDFTDEVASGLMTHLHRSWGHTGRAVDPGFIADVRAETADRNAMWTVADLMTLDINTHYRRYEGRYGSPEFVLEFVYNGKGLEVKSGIFNGPMTPLKEDQFLFEPRGLRVEFVFDDAGAVVGIRMPTGDGESLLPRLASAG